MFSIFYIDTVFSIYLRQTPCFPYFRLRVFHIFTSEYRSVTPAPGLRLRVFHVTIFSTHFTTFFNQISEFYFFCKVLSGSFGFFVCICLDQKLVYNANCPFGLHFWISGLLVYCILGDIFVYRKGNKTYRKLIVSLY